MCRHPRRAETFDQARLLPATGIDARNLPALKKESSSGRPNQPSRVRLPVLFLGAFLCTAAAAQIMAPATAATAQPQASAPVDIFNRATPRNRLGIAAPVQDPFLETRLPFKQADGVSR